MKLANGIKWRVAYFLLYWEMTFLKIDAWLFENQGNHIIAADCDCRAYDCQRKMQNLKLFRGL